MSDLKATEYKRFEDVKQVRSDGSEFWRARELAPCWNTQNGKILPRSSSAL